LNWVSNAPAKTYQKTNPDKCAYPCRFVARNPYLLCEIKTMSKCFMQSNRSLHEMHRQDGRQNNQQKKGKGW